jgi:competence protein ComEC
MKRPKTSDAVQPPVGNLLIATKNRPFSIFGRFYLAGLWFFTLCLVFFTPPRPPPLRLVACDVGQGDAILGIYGQSAILIDSGPNQAILRCLRQKLPFGQSKIAVSVLSHWDADHVGGFSDVFQGYEAGLIFADPKTKDTNTAAETAKAIESRGGPLAPFPGDEVVFPGGRMRFLWSAAAAATGKSAETDDTEENNRSVGVQLLVPGFGFLGLGDLECRSELAVASMPLLIGVQILKVSHHGSKTASCPEFLAKISPEIGIVSVGAGNKYGHPAAETLENLSRAGVFVLRTDQAGAWEVSRRDSGWILRSERAAGEQ